jgi:starvation-inducible DNA-binding protein
VRGSHFRDYHLLLDEQAAQIFAVSYILAERPRKLGATTFREQYKENALSLQRPL